MRRNKKRLLSVLLSTMIALSLFAAAPMTVFATTPPPGPYSPIAWDLINTDGSGIFVASGTWTWDSTNRILTLDNIIFNTTADYALGLPDGTTIILIGNSTITSTNASPNTFSDGIYADGNLTITGGGSLVVSSGPANTASYGILSTGGLTISDGSAVTSISNNAPISIGIYAFDGLTISGGSTVTATGGTATSFSAGIFAISNFLINGDSVIIATGGSVSDEDPLLNTGSYGIYKWGGSGIPAFILTSSMLQAAGETMAIVIFDNSTNVPTLSYFTVPAGYTYWVNELMSDPGGSGTISEGSFLISSLYRFARIMFVPPPPPPSPNVPQTSDMSNAVGWTVLLALVIFSVFGLVAWRRKQGARE